MKFDGKAKKYFEKVHLGYTNCVVSNLRLFDLVYIYTHQYPRVKPPMARIFSTMEGGISIPRRCDIDVARNCRL